MPDSATQAPAAADFAALHAGAAEALDGPELDAAARAARVALWRAQEWHGWFRWAAAARGFDWSKLVWFLVLAGGLGALVWYGIATDAWHVTAGGIVAWFTVVNLGFFSYLGLHPPRPPLPIPGPFAAGRKVRARMALYPAGYDGRKLPRLWLKVARAGTADGKALWLFELPVAGGLDPRWAELLARQTTFRMQRGDAPAMRAVCETRNVTRAQVDGGAHPLQVLAWEWDAASTEVFGRP